MLYEALARAFRKFENLSPGFLQQLIPKQKHCNPILSHFRVIASNPQPAL
jgi:hypothetical protein